MTDPIDLAVEREARRDSEDYDGVFCSCGEAWFNIRGVIDKGGSRHGIRVAADLRGVRH